MRLDQQYSACTLHHTVCNPSLQYPCTLSGPLTRGMHRNLLRCACMHWGVGSYPCADLSLSLLAHFCIRLCAIHHDSDAKPCNVSGPVAFGMHRNLLCFSLHALVTCIYQICSFIITPRMRPASSCVRSTRRLMQYPCTLSGPLTRGMHRDALCFGQHALAIWDNIRV